MKNHLIQFLLEKNLINRKPKAEIATIRIKPLIKEMKG